MFTLYLKAKNFRARLAPYRDNPDLVVVRSQDREDRFHSKDSPWEIDFVHAGLESLIQKLLRLRA